MSKYVLNEPSLSGGSLSTTGRPVRVAGCQEVVATVVVTVTAATLQGSLTLGSTNDLDRALSATSVLAIPTTTLITTAPTGLSFSAGVVTINNPAVGSSELSIAITGYGQFVRPSYVWTSGGGTVLVTCQISGWSD